MKVDVDELKEYIDCGISLHDIGKYYNISRQRVYQICTKFGIETFSRKKFNYLKDKDPRYYWFNKMLVHKKVDKVTRLDMLESIYLPDDCPILGLKLDYNGDTLINGKRSDNSPSVDKIIPSKGYIKENIHIISWRANRIKNDATPEELLKIAEYFQHLVL